MKSFFICLMLLSCTLGYSQSIASAEYFFNTDPGVGNGTPLSVNTNSGQLSQTYNIDVSSLANGFHSLYIRTLDSDNAWSHYDRQIFYIVEDNNSPITNAEYFINADPGFGNGTQVNVSSSPQVINVGTTGLALGDHLVCVRVQNSDGNWSQSDCEVFTIDATAGVADNLYTQTKVYPNPFVNTLNISTLNINEIESAAIINMQGKIVYENNSDLNTLDLANLATSVYILKLNTKEESASFKIVKQ